MSSERWIIVDTKASNAADDARYLGLHGWHCAIVDAGTFRSREEAAREARLEYIDREPRIRIRRVVTRHDRGDEACAMALATALAERDAARAELAQIRAAIETLIARAAK